MLGCAGWLGGLASLAALRCIVTKHLEELEKTTKVNFANLPKGIFKCGAKSRLSGELSRLSSSCGLLSMYIYIIFIYIYIYLFFSFLTHWLPWET